MKFMILGAVTVCVINMLSSTSFKSAMYWLFPDFFTAPKSEADSDIKNDK